MGMQYWSFGGASDHLSRQKAGTDDRTVRSPRVVAELKVHGREHLGTEQAEVQLGQSDNSIISLAPQSGSVLPFDEMRALIRRLPSPPSDRDGVASAR